MLVNLKNDEISQIVEDIIVAIIQKYPHYKSVLEDAYSFLDQIRLIIPPKQMIRLNNLAIKLCNYNPILTNFINEIITSAPKKDTDIEEYAPSILYYMETLPEKEWAKGLLTLCGSNSPIRNLLGQRAKLLFPDF